jgi:hypothetical protein
VQTLLNSLPSSKYLSGAAASPAIVRNKLRFVRRILRARRIELERLLRERAEALPR